MKTLPLSWDTWDLELDNVGNLSLRADEASSVAQDVASSIRTFLGECWYNTSLGMPYFQSIFGKYPPASLVASKIQQQAFTIDSVTTARMASLQLVNRQLIGTVVTTSTASKLPIVVNF